MSETPKIALNLVLTGLGLFVAATRPAEAATFQFELSFFDENRNPVGNGQFSYDDAEVTCIQLSPAGVCEPNDPLFGLLDAILVKNVLTDFSATVDGENWHLSLVSWWNDESSGQLAGSQLVSRSGPRVRDNFWFFGDPFFGREQLYLDFVQSSEPNAEGNWGLQVFPSNSSMEPKFNSGTWQARRADVELQPSSAETVPEPSTLVGSFISLVLVTLLLKHKSQKHSHSQQR